MTKTQINNQILKTNISQRGLSYKRPSVARQGGMGDTPMSLLQKSNQKLQAACIYILDCLMPTGVFRRVSVEEKSSKTSKLVDYQRNYSKTGSNPEKGLKMQNCSKHKWDLLCECKERQWNQMPRSERQAIIAEINASNPDATEKDKRKSWTIWSQLVNYFKVKLSKEAQNETTQNGAYRI